MTTTAVRDKRIAVTEAKIEKALNALDVHEHHVTRITAEIAHHQRTLAWLHAMPADDPPESLASPADSSNASDQPGNRKQTTLTGD